MSFVCVCMTNLVPGWLLSTGNLWLNTQPCCAALCHCMCCQVSELLSRGMSDLDERAAELSSRQERLLADLAASSSSMTNALAQER
jgi:hypothetical protein